ncbi:hypothetical protein HAX54_015879 [Datura stramonium]|uniref:EF-hand domain-containing protein n=1 Tax=Datura stramonium TaxID=4076 RepID=A0ABS8UK77_DATST|nr:hypothetical protein [Datura stramonium]
MATNQEDLTEAFRQLGSTSIPRLPEPSIVLIRMFNVTYIVTCTSSGNMDALGLSELRGGSGGGGGGGAVMAIVSYRYNEVVSVIATCYQGTTVNVMAEVVDDGSGSCNDTLGYRIQEMVEEIDANKDGKISKEDSERRSVQQTGGWFCRIAATGLLNLPIPTAMDALDDDEIVNLKESALKHLGIRIVSN